MSDYQNRLAEDARLTILKELAAENSYSLNETILREILETFGVNRDRAWVRAQLKIMAGLDAVVTRQANSVMIAVLTRTGLDHVKGRTVIEGIARPSPEG